MRKRGALYASWRNRAAQISHRRERTAAQIVYLENMMIEEQDCTGLTGRRRSKYKIGLAFRHVDEEKQR
jgi:hypothetical protein